MAFRVAKRDLRSATGTGIAKDPYANLVIALKSAYQTYGENLPNDEQKRVREIIAHYDLVVQLWENFEEGGDVSTITKATSVSGLTAGKNKKSPRDSNRRH